MGKIILVENTSEIGAGTRGAGLGIDALKVVARQRQSGFFARFDWMEIPNENYILDEPTEYNYGKRIDALERIYEKTANAVSSVLRSGDFPLVLAGDHASAGGTIAGIKMADPSKRVGVIWIDAHADLHTPYTTPSGNLHGMPLATALNTDNLECKQNDPKSVTAGFWERLKGIGGVKPKVKPEDIVFIGVRDTEEPEDQLIARENIKNYTIDEVREKGPAIILQEIDQKLSNCDIIYVSFDVDSMDCILVSKGTGTPVENGLTPQEAETFMVGLAGWHKTACVEVVEINPCLDDKINKMAETAYEILEKFTPVIENRI